MPLTTSVLLIEDNLLDAQLAQTALEQDPEHKYELEWVTSIADAFKWFTQKSPNKEVDIILLALNSATRVSLTAFNKLIAAAPKSLIVLLSAEDNFSVVEQLMKMGAHDYLLKKHMDSYWLPKALQYIERQKFSVSSLKTSEAALYQEKELAQITLNSIADAVVTTNLAGKLTYLNAVAEKMTGWSANEAIGKPLTDVFNIVDRTSRRPISNPALKAIHENKSVVIPPNSVLIRRDGAELDVEDSTAPIHNREKGITGAVIVFHDVSEMRRLATKMSHLAQYDSLTGLPNRTLLTERLSRAIASAKRNTKKVSLFFLDLDFFKNVNDSLGHEIGDGLLKSVADRLVSCVRETDTVCRQGGDEFVILLNEIDSLQDAAFTAEKLLEAFKQPHLINSQEIYVAFSMGISIYPDDAKDADGLLHCADAAMYHAKAVGKNNFQFFKNEMNRRAIHRLSVGADLRRALRNNEFVLFYQPKIELATGNLVGAEALIRWQDPERGLVGPEQFIAIAEEVGLIVPIGRWVLREACRQLDEWRAQGFELVPIAINISVLELRNQHFLSFIEKMLQEKNIQKGSLEMELTETILMNDADLSINVLTKLKEMGIPLAIDDFGKGYSSLSYLKRFPINTLKMDQSFIQDMMKDTKDAAIVIALIGLGHNLKQSLVAEGVETSEQFEFLTAQGCDQAQGDFFSPALPAEEFSKLLIFNDKTPQLALCASVPIT